MDGKYAVPAFLDVKSRDGNLNLVLCVVSSAVAGIGIGLFGCLLSAADHIRRRNGGLHTVRSRFFSWIGMIGSARRSGFRLGQLSHSGASWIDAAGKRHL